MGGAPWYVLVGLSMFICHCWHTTATGQEPRLKLLEYADDSSPQIKCGAGPYFVPDTVKVQPGVLVDLRQVYCQNCWMVFVGEQSVDAEGFQRRVGDTTTIEECEFLPDSSRAILRKFEERFGALTLRRANVSTNPLDKCLFYDVIFDKPTNLGEVWDYAQGIHEENSSILNILTGWPCAELTTEPNDRVFDGRLTTEYLHHDGSFNAYFPATAHTRTRAWALYSIKAPMAWDVTMGHKDVIIGAEDQLVGCDSLQNIDLVERDSQLETGNVRAIYGALTAADLGRPSNTGNGVLMKSTMALKSSFNASGNEGHGIDCLSAAIGKANNDNLANPSSGPEGSTVGSAPECNGIVVQGSWTSSSCLGYQSNSRIVRLTEEASRIDLDFTVDPDNKQEIVDVMYHSHVAGSTDLVIVCRRGVVLIASAGNARSTPTIVNPAADLFPHATDPKKDTKVIAVAAIMDGTQYRASNCQPWHPSDPPPVWLGAERFRDGWNYSRGADKFNTNANHAARSLAKKDAFVDLVAPGEDVWTVVNGTRKYRYAAGTSLSGPLVAGVVGLMLSVSDHLGTPWDPILDKAVTDANGLAHQRRAYDILTFTADKIADGSSNPDFDYVLQTNDVLQRHWARRMGFGKVNAYRSVAHAVPHKAAYAYTTSGTLAFDPAVVNPDGKKLMHMGSKINDGIDWVFADGRGPDPLVLDGQVNVIEYGGTNLPGQVYQNQGVTRISSPNVATRTDLTVPTDCLLLIDGLVLTEVNPQSKNRIIATSEGSRILMEGYLKNVFLVGRLTLGDLVVDGAELAPGLFMNRGSDIYGTVQLLGDAHFSVSEVAHGATTLRTGSHLQLNGSRNLMVQWDGRLELDHSSAISTTQNRVVLVENGALYVKPGANVKIDAHVHVWDGQLFEIGDTSVVYIKSLTVNPGATFRVKPGAHVIFGSDEVTINGHFDAVGGSTEDRLRVVFTSEINTNGTNCTFDPRSHDFLAKRTRVRVEGAPSLAGYPLSSARASYCDFKNVSLELKNVRTEPFIRNAFTAKRTSPNNSPGNVWSIQPFMLRYESDNTVAGLPTDFYELRVAHSSFSDVEGNVATPAPTTLVNDYTISGIQCISALRAEVEDNTFTNLVYGLFTANTLVNHVRSNTFEHSDAGVLASTGSLLVCDNSTNNVKLPLAGSSLAYSRYFDNIFNVSRVGVFFLNCQVQAFRNNEFNEYWTGINSMNTIVSLTSLHPTTYALPILAYGRNRFNVSNPALYPGGVGHPNPYTNAAQYQNDVDLLSDLNYATGATYLLRCGYNAFSQFATNHLTAPWMPTPTVDVSDNNFRPNGAVRQFNVNVTGAPQNVSQAYYESCGDAIEPSTCSIFNITGSPVFGKSGVERNPEQPLQQEQHRTGQLVFEQTRVTVNQLTSVLQHTCQSALFGATFELSETTASTETVPSVADLYQRLRAAAPGVYALRVLDPGNGTCSILMLIVR